MKEKQVSDSVCMVWHAHRLKDKTNLCSSLMYSSCSWMYLKCGLAIMIQVSVEAAVFCGAKLCAERRDKGGEHYSNCL